MAPGENKDSGCKTEQIINFTVAVIFVFYLKIEIKNMAESVTNKEVLSEFTKCCKAIAKHVNNINKDIEN